jgi:hypothetical protein
MKTKYLICVDNKGYEASLEFRKLYEQVSDKEADRHGQVRIVDESGEDYLYPVTCFASVKLPSEIENKIRQIGTGMP